VKTRNLLLLAGAGIGLYLLARPGGLSGSSGGGVGGVTVPNTNSTYDARRGAGGVPNTNSDYDARRGTR
jgi:hypothetical protein